MGFNGVRVYSDENPFKHLINIEIRELEPDGMIASGAMPYLLAIMQERTYGI